MPACYLPEGGDDSVTIGIRPGSAMQEGRNPEGLSATTALHIRRGREETGEVDVPTRVSSTLLCVSHAITGGPWRQHLRAKPSVLRRSLSDGRKPLAYWTSLKISSRLS